VAGCAAVGGKVVAILTKHEPYTID
jgi:hypothetical protein